MAAPVFEVGRLPVGGAEALRVGGVDERTRLDPVGALCGGTACRFVSLVPFVWSVAVSSCAAPSTVVVSDRSGTLMP